jgi:hypothetical protein
MAKLCVGELIDLLPHSSWVFLNLGCKPTFSGYYTSVSFVRRSPDRIDQWGRRLAVHPKPGRTAGKSREPFPQESFMPQPKADTVLHKDAEAQAYSALLSRYGYDAELAMRKMRTAQARHVEHYGQATAQELRDLWESVHPDGPPRRQYVPDQYALLWALADATDIRNEGAVDTGAPGMEEFEAAGMHAAVRKMLLGANDPYRFHVLAQVWAGKVYDQPRLGRFIRSLNPGHGRPRRIDPGHAEGGLPARPPAEMGLGPMPQ